MAGKNNHSKNNNSKGQSKGNSRDHGSHIIKGTNQDDILHGNSKNNIIYGYGGDDQLFGERGNDALLGGSGNDTLAGNDGNDLLIGDSGDDTLQGGSGNDWLFGGSGNDQLEGGSGNDTIAGESGNDQIAGDSGNDHIYAGSGSDVVAGGDGKDFIDGSHGDDILSGGNDKDKIYGGTGNDVINGGAGMDKLYGSSGNDTITGGQGNDIIRGESGDDHIIWSAGDGSDYIDGGRGNDSFTLNTSDNIPQVVQLNTNRRGDLVVNIDGPEGGEFTLRSIENFNLSIGLAGASIQLGDIPDGALGDEPLDLGGGEGSDEIDASGSNQAVNIDAGTGDDTVTGGNANDTISGGEGTDVISGGGGDDIIDAGVGNDKVIWSNGDGNDTIDGGEGFDELDLNLDETQPSSLSISADANGNVILVGSDGSQLTVDGIEDIVINAGAAGTQITIGDLTGTDIAQDTLYFVGGAGDDGLDASATDRRINAKGNGGNDTLISGSGNDTLDGGAGDDILNAGSGQGVDTILGGSGNDQITAVLGDEQGSDATDIVDGGDDIDSLNVIFVEPTPHNLYLTVQSNGDGSFSVTSSDIDVDEILKVTNVENLQITAGDDSLNYVLGSLADTALVQNGVSFTGSEGADSFDASATDVRLFLDGKGGDDNLIGGSERDSLLGGDGNDSLRGEGGTDILFGGAGNDILDGGEGIDLANYYNAVGGVTINLGITEAQDTVSEGMDTLVNIERVNGSLFNDSLTGNDDDNFLFGNDGDDILVGGAGFDNLFGGAGNDSLTDDVDGGLLSGGAGADFIDGTATYENGDAGVLVNLSNMDVDIFGDASLILAARSAVDEFGDTDTFGANAINLHASNYADHITGSDDAQYVFARAGDDLINTLGGNDTIFAGSGNDTVDGGAGVDWIDYTDDGFDAAGPATQGINVDLANNTAIDNFGATDSLSNIENVAGSAFADIIVGDSNNNVLLGLLGNDTVSGGDGNDFVGGFYGDDILNGGAGNDYILGAADNDTLTGGAGNDTFGLASDNLGNAEFGHDTITDFNVTEDIIDFTPLTEITSLQDVLDLTTDDGIDTTISVDSDRSITLLGVTTAQLGASNFTFGDGGSAEIEGTPDNDVLTGTEDDDVIRALEGNDVIAGLAGNDLIDGGEGRDAADHRTDPAGVTVDLLNAIAWDGYGDTDILVNIENAIGSQFNDNLIASNQGSVLVGQGGMDLLEGGDGSDYILGGEGNDTIYGGASWDNLFGEGGDDTLIEIDGGSLDGGDGNDTLTGANNFWNELIGGNGDDILIDPDGSGMLDGGAGNDSLDGRPKYENDPDGVMVNFSNADWDVYGDASVIVAGRTAKDGYGDTDTLEAGAIDINASFHDDFVMGSDFRQYFDLRAGNDTAYGMDGDDNFRGGSGNDVIYGGAGFDNLDFQDDGFDGSGLTVSQGVVVNLSGADFNTGSVQTFANTVTDGFGDTDSVYEIEGVNGTDFDDVIVGHEFHNWLEGAGGNDAIYGGGDSDNLIGGAGNDLIDGQDGDPDAAWYNYIGADHGIDVNLAEGKTYDDGTGGEDTLISIERIEGSEFDDLIVGDGGRNSLYGNEGHDVIYGGAGDDNLEGRQGNDELYGEDGNDWFLGQEGDDLMDGGSGIDQVNYDGWSGTTTGISVDLGNLVDAGGYVGVAVVSHEGINTTDYLRNIEDISGTDFNDLISGDSENNSLFGRAGDDHLIGGAGDDFLEGGDDFDTLEGGAGQDTLDGGENNDMLTGGAERDFFRFTRFTNQGDLTSFGQDTITDFSVSEDVLDLYNVPEFSNLTALQNAASQDGADLVISFESDFNGISETNSIRLNNVDISDLQNMEIWFRPLQGTEGADVITGTAERDNIEALGGDDTIYAGAGDDDIRDDAGNDTVYGEAGDDWIHGSQGNDTIDGGDDYDHVAYDDWQIPDGIMVNLDLPFNQVLDDGYGTSDTLINVEGVVGSDWGDTIFGNADANNLQGRAGDDILSGFAGFDFFVGGPGNDVIDGGADIDVISYESWNVGNHGVIVDLNQGLALNDGFDNIDTLINIENIFGSDYDDQLTGDALGNNLQANGGNDVITGGGGSDYMEGGWGDDLFIFSDADGSGSFDTIADFEAGSGSDDVIDFSGLSIFNDFDSVFAAATADGSNTNIDLGNSNTLQLIGISPSDLDIADFMF